MSTRSIRFRLVAWYAGLLTGVFLLLGALMYFNLRHFLENDLGETQTRRARQIADTLKVSINTVRSRLKRAREKLIAAQKR